MKCIDVHLRAKAGEEFNITPLFDLHEEARDCAREMVAERIAERNELPNHYMFFGGDVMNCVLPKDFVRSTPSTAAKEIAVRDDYLNATLELAMEEWASHAKRILFVGKGNHEQQVVKYHSYDIVREFARRLGVPAGGYSGLLRIHFVRPQGKVRCRFSILWHHGAWGGEVLQGLGGAERFAFKIRYPWDVFCFGHNHKTNTRFYDMIDFTQRGKQIYAPVAIIGCGTYLKTLSGDDQPDYAEQRGYPPVHLGSPLINIRVLNDPDKNTGQYLRWRVINE